jgi:hypothetical protein
MDTDGDFVPKQSTGIRPIKKDGFMYIRLAMPYTAISNNGTSVIKVMKTNVFNADTKLEMLLEAYDISIGFALPNVVLVTEETLTTPGVTPGGQLKGGWQIKYAGSDSKIPCTFIGEHNGVTYDTPAPIYYRVRLMPKGTQDDLIANVNNSIQEKSQISEFDIFESVVIGNSNVNSIDKDRLDSLKKLTKHIDDAYILTGVMNFENTTMGNYPNFKDSSDLILMINKVTENFKNETQKQKLIDEFGVSASLIDIVVDSISNKYLENI